MDEVKTAEQSGTQTGGRNRRSWKNYFISPGGQVRLVFGIPVLGLLAVICLLVMLRSALNTSLDGLAEANPGLTDRVRDIESVASFILELSIGACLLSTVMVATFGVLISHKFYGPIVPIVRTLGEFAEGKFSGRVRLRPNDELTQIQDAINRLGDSLEARPKV